MQCWYFHVANWNLDSNVRWATVFTMSQGTKTFCLALTYHNVYFFLLTGNKNILSFKTDHPGCHCWYTKKVICCFPEYTPEYAGSGNFNATANIGHVWLNIWALFVLSAGLHRPLYFWLPFHCHLQSHFIWIALFKQCSRELHITAPKRNPPMKNWNHEGTNNLWNTQYIIHD